MRSANRLITTIALVLGLAGPAWAQTAQFNTLFDTRLAASSLADDVENLRQWFDPRDYNGAPGDSTLDTDAIQDAIDDADAVDGGVTLDTGTWLIDDTLTLPDDSKISIKGVPGGTVIQAKAGTTWTVNQPMLVVDSVNGLGSRYGSFRDFLLDGNHLAGMGCDFCGIQRLVENVDVIYCNRVGWYMRGAQNCRLVSCNFEQNGTDHTAIDTSPMGTANDILFPDGNEVVDQGAGNNVHIGCEYSPLAGADDAGVWNLVICQSGSSPSFGFDEPTLNMWIASQFERSADDSWAGAILHTAGRRNLLDMPMIAIDGVRPAIKLDDTDDDLQAPDLISGSLIINKPMFFGTDEQSTAILVDTADVPAVIVDSPLMENFEHGFKVNDGSVVHITGTPEWGSTDNPVSSNGGTNTAAGLLTQPLLRLDQTPSNTTDTPPATSNSVATFYDGLGQILWAYYGEWRGAQMLAKSVGYYETTAGGAINIDFAGRTHTQVHVVDTTSFTINGPSNLQVNGRYSIDVYNTSGTMGTITWHAGTFKMDGSYSNPANTKHKITDFIYDGFYLRQLSPTTGAIDE